MSRKPADDRTARSLPEQEGPDVTVVVLVAPDSSADAIGRSLESLRRQSLPTDLYDIVLNGARDGADGTATAEGMRVLWHECRSPVVALLGAGCEAHPAWLAEVFAAFGDFASPPALVAGPVEGVWPGPRPSWLPDALLSWLPVVDLGPTSRHLSGVEGISTGNLAFRRDLLLRPAVAGDTGSFPADREGVLLETARRLTGSGPLFYAAEARTRRPVEPEKLTPDWLLAEAERRGRAAARREITRGEATRRPLVAPLRLAKRLRAAFGPPGSPATMKARCDLAHAAAFRAEIRAAEKDRRRNTQRS